MVGNKFRLGMKLSDEHKRKIGAALMGDKAYNWKGENVKYRTLHNWLNAHLGKPDQCKHCGIKANGHLMHWANVSGEYKRDFSDWIRLCAKCHGKHDAERRVMMYS